MKGFRPAFFLSISMLLTSVSFGAVNVSSPASGATVASPVTFAGSASTTSCAAGVASMGVYIDNVLKFVSQGTKLNASLEIEPGSHRAVVEEWDLCGGATYKAVPITVTAETGVWVTTPKNGATVDSPVQFTATSSAASCAKGVASMGVYVNNKLTAVQSGHSLSKQIDLGPGTYDTVVEEWDYCGGAHFTPVKVTVAGASETPGSTGAKVISNIQANTGWKGYGEFPPVYAICTSCGKGVVYSITHGITSPSMTGNAAEFHLGGITPYSDVLWVNSLIGDVNTHGLPDPNHTIVKSLHNFTYDLYFYGSDLEASQVLEFDINQYFGGKGFIFGTQCRIAGGHMWDIWNNVTNHWISTGVACNPASNKWNHVVVKVHRTSTNQMVYDSIALNGTVHTLNKTTGLHSVPAGWNGIGVNFQTDGNKLQSPYAVVVDKFNFTYF